MVKIMAKIFDVLNDISYMKKGVLKTPLTHPINEGENFDIDEFRSLYSIGMANKAFGRHPDALFRLDIINKLSTDPLFHHDMLMLMLPTRLRKGKWMKELKDERIRIISEYYNVRSEVAAKYSKLITDDELNDMKSSLDENIHK
jgi:hypothetical protein